MLWFSLSQEEVLVEDSIEAEALVAVESQEAPDANQVRRSFAIPKTFSLPYNSIEKVCNSNPGF